jgi:putative ABC transport system ATP-binding protein
MSETILMTEGLTREYRMGRNVIKALDQVDLNVQSNEFISIMGPSGCGKSTLLNLMGGLDQPTTGKVLLDGEDLGGYNEEELAALRREKLGLIFQRHELFPVLTARENVEFPMLLDGIDQVDRSVRADELLALVGMAGKASFLPDELSGGQQQRVGIARALANKPQILLADEPTGNLDSDTASEIVNILQALIRDMGLTLIMVTHDPETASRADRILHLKDGRMVDERGAIK